MLRTGKPSASQNGLAPLLPHPYYSGVGAAFTRIFSDIHYFDGASRVRALEQLDPLLDGVTHLVLNGDTLDTQRTPDPEAAMAAIRDYFRSRVAKTTFISGNHDPIISETHELTLHHGQVWITHGDILFDAIAPWSVMAKRLRSEVHRLRAEFPEAERDTIPALFAAHRATSRSIHVEFDTSRNDWLYRWWRLFSSIFPPTHFFGILKAWRDMPALGAAFAAKHHPEARVILLGHNHAPHFGTYQNRLVINTGSFCPPRSALCADISDESVVVRRILRRTGSFHPGPALAEFPLAKPDPVPPSSQSS